jgi:hypothetical protein
MKIDSRIKIALAVVLIFIIGFFAGMEYKAYQIRSAIGEAVGEMADAFNEGFNIEEEVKEEEEKSQPATEFVDVVVGDLVELATLKFTVNKVTETQTVSGTFGSPKIAKNGAKFVLLDVSITNTTNSEFDFNTDDGFRLIDDGEREFSEYGDSIGAIENYLSWRTLSPGITERGTLIYEIPSDANSYSWAVGKGGTNQIYRVKLK